MAQAVTWNALEVTYENQMCLCDARDTPFWSHWHKTFVIKFDWFDWIWQLNLEIAVKFDWFDWIPQLNLKIAVKFDWFDSIIFGNWIYRKSWVKLDCVSIAFDNRISIGLIAFNWFGNSFDRHRTKTSENLLAIAMAAITNKLRLGRPTVFQIQNPNKFRSVSRGKCRILRFHLTIKFVTWLACILQTNIVC